MSKINDINISENNLTNKEEDINININLNNLKSSNNNNSNNKNKNNDKKSEKSPSIFFLFDTVKNKNKKKPKSKSPKNIKTEINEHFALSFISSNNKSSKINTFYEKLHNNILKNDKKVDNIKFINKY